MTTTTTVSREELAADAALSAVSGRLHLVPALSPTNLRSEREAFLSGERTNPRFAYDINDAEIKQLRRAVKTISAPDTAVGALLEAKRAETLTRLDMLAAIGTPRFSELSQELYGVPDAGTIAEANSVLDRERRVAPESKPAPNEEGRLSAKAVADAIRDVLEQHGLDDWHVELTDKTVAGVVVDPPTQRIYVAAHTTLEVSRLAPLLTHEVETHVLTAENGRHQPLSLFVQGFAGYLSTQEGLAAYNVSTQHPSESRPVRFWARNALAVDLAQRHSFREVFEAIKAFGFNEHYAFGVCAKVKRGLIDTSEPGGWTKDYVYLAGRRAISAFVAGGGDLRELYVGKIALSALPQLRTFGWLKPAMLLPRFLSKAD